MSILRRAGDGEGGRDEAVEPGAILRAAVADAAGRIEEIITAAERVAREIQADAEAAADDYVQRRRREVDAAASEQAEALQALAGDLEGQLAALQRQGESIVVALQQAADRLRALPGPAEPGPSPAEAPRAEGEPAEPVRPADSGEAVDDAALLRATQLAVAGTDRKTIEDVLRRDFGLEQPGPLVDRILGAG